MTQFKLCHLNKSVHYLSHYIGSKKSIGIYQILTGTSRAILLVQIPKGIIHVYTPIVIK